MEEIKFRAWANGQMYYQRKNYWWYFGDSGYWSLNIGEKIICDSLESKNPHLMSYTGRKARGKYIYEGDILENGDNPWIVTWKAPSFIKMSREGYEAYGYYRFIREQEKVIGNIYENPELIK